MFLPVAKDHSEIWQQKRGFCRKCYFCLAGAPEAYKWFNHLMYKQNSQVVQSPATAALSPSLPFRQNKAVQEALIKALPVWLAWRIKELGSGSRIILLPHHSELRAPHQLLVKITTETGRVAAAELRWSTTTVKVTTSLHCISVCALPAPLCSSIILKLSDWLEGWASLQNFRNKCLCTTATTINEVRSISLLKKYLLQVTY